MWRRLKYRVIYGVLGVLRWLARRFPRLRVPRWVPLAGSIDGRSLPPPVAIRDRRFGRSMAVPPVLRIEIDGRTGTTSPAVLQPVAERLFAAHPPFTFNVSFACGRARRFRAGVYADPHSHWFNVFAGYYEIDVAKSASDHPFGYKGTAGAWTIDTDDLGRLGSADWNYFSNFMYGVPLAAIEAVDQPVATFGPPASIAIAGRRWDHVRAAGMRASSAYLARSGDELVETVPGLTDVWRVAFGLPYRGAEPPPRAFFATDMRAEFYACFVADETHWRTYIFGGTVNEWWERDDAARADFNRAFLAHQMAEIEKLIARHFAHLGFAPSARAEEQRHVDGGGAVRRGER